MVGVAGTEKLLLNVTVILLFPFKAPPGTLVLNPTVQEVVTPAVCDAPEKPRCPRLKRMPARQKGPGQRQQRQLARWQRIRADALVPAGALGRHASGEGVEGIWSAASKDSPC